MKKIKWGIAGAGSIAKKFARAVNNIDEATLCAVASRSEEKAKSFAKEFGIPNFFSSYGEMASFNDVDAVYVATTHPFHKSCAEFFLNAKKHVLCEKPLCVNTADALALKECAQKNKVFLMEAMWTKFLPAITEAKKLIKNGKIGEIKSITADFCYNAMDDEPDEKIFSNKQAGGGLLDVGIYGLHFASYIMDSSPESIISCADMKNDVDYHCCATLKYSNGTIANISSAIALYKPETAYIYGTKGFICIPQFYGAKEFYLNIDGTEEKYLFPPIADGFEEEILESCRCINGGKLQSEIHPLTSTIEILKQMDFIRGQIGLVYPFDN